jgi:hypothetical protein
MDPEEEEAIVKMSRRFSAARVDFVVGRSNPDWSAIQKRILAISAKLEGIKDLVIDGHQGLILPQAILLACHLLPQVEVCKMKFQRDSQINGYSSALLRQHFSTDSFRLAKYDSLTDLKVEHCDSEFLTHVLLKSKNLKRLSIEDDYLFTLKINNTSVWVLVTFNLEKLDLFIKEPIKFESFKGFLTKQTNLREITIGESKFDFKSLVETQPNIKTINTDRVAFLDDIPHEHFHKFKIFVGDEQRDAPGNVFMESFFGSYVPENIDSFESNVLAFLDRDTNIPGLKNSHMITKIIVGSTNWVKTGATLSDEFILNVIAKTPNITYFETRFARTVGEIKRTIDRSGLNVSFYEIRGTDGVRRIHRNGLEQDYGFSSEDEETDEDVEIYYME